MNNNSKRVKCYIKKGRKLETMLTQRRSYGRRTHRRKVFIDTGVPRKQAKFLQNASEGFIFSKSAS